LTRYSGGRDIAFIVNRKPSRLLSWLVPLGILAFGLAGCQRKSPQPRLESLGTHKATLTWRASASPVIGYRVYRATNPNDPPGLIGVTPADTTRFTDNSVEPGRTYFYVVKAFDSANKESAPSTKVTATIPMP
jgi:fibronectin type III domain protein